jgi:hypothetical protein
VWKLHVNYGPTMERRNAMGHVTLLR